MSRGGMRTMGAWAVLTVVGCLAHNMHSRLSKSNPRTAGHQPRFRTQASRRGAMTMTETQSPRFLAVDFYCGAGGTTRGLIDAGGYVIAGIDKDETCRETYRENNPNLTLDCKKPEYLALDMFPVAPEYPQGQKHLVLDKLRTLIQKVREDAPGIPLLFAICAPCQSFTKFVQRRMSEDRANGRERDKGLLAQTLDFIEEFRPEMVISENVAGIERGKYREIWTDFQEKLDVSYHTGATSVCASRFGVPQYRRRSILMAVRKDNPEAFQFNLAIPESDPHHQTSRTVQDAISHLPSIEAGGQNQQVANHECRNLVKENRQRLQSLKPGEPNWKLEDTDFGDLRLECHKRLTKKGSPGFGDVYTRMRPDRPSPTITTRFHSISNGRFGHYDTAQVRGLSLREGAALQSFGDDYEFHGGSMDRNARMIGNAVPPMLSKFMANQLYDLWDKNGRTMAKGNTVEATE